MAGGRPKIDMLPVGAAVGFPQARGNTRRRCDMNTPQAITGTSRRRFLRGAAAATGAAALGFPMVVKAQGPISMRWQSTWPAKDIFHEYANDFAKKVNDMTGGDLKIEVLPAGAVVPAFGLLDAVSKGTLDGGHGRARQELPARRFGGCLRSVHPAPPSHRWLEVHARDVMPLTAPASGRYSNPPRHPPASPARPALEAGVG